MYDSEVKYNRVTPVEVFRFDGTLDDVEELVVWIRERTNQPVQGVSYHPELRLGEETQRCSVTVNFEPSRQENHQDYLVVSAGAWVVYEEGKAFLDVSDESFRTMYQEATQEMTNLLDTKGHPVTNISPINNLL